MVGMGAMITKKSNREASPFATMIGVPATNQFPNVVKMEKYVDGVITFEWWHNQYDRTREFNEQHRESIKN